MTVHRRKNAPRGVDRMRKTIHPPLEIAELIRREALATGVSQAFLTECAIEAGLKVMLTGEAPAPKEPPHEKRS